VFVSLALLVWVFSGIDWAALTEALVHANLFWLIPGFVMIVLHHFLRAWRWRVLLSEPDCSLRLLFDGIIIGACANFLLPLRAGEFVRPLVVTHKQKNISYSRCFASVVVERFLDLSFVLLSFCLMLIWLPNVPNWAIAGAYSLGTIAGVLFVYIVSGSLFPDPTERFIQFFLVFFPQAFREKILSIVRDFLLSASALRDPMTLLFVLAQTVLVWGSCFVIFFFFLLPFDLPPSLALATVVAVIVALAVAAPSAPGFVGVYQTGCVAGFFLFGIEGELPVAFSIVSHVAQYIFFVGYGFYALSRLNLKFSELTAAKSIPVEAV
jgi:hypothetical protein